MKFYSFHPGMNSRVNRNFFIPGWHFISVTCKRTLRRCLHAKFYPGMTFHPGRNHPCLWWNVSYCLHIFVEMKFHPRTNSSLSKRQGLNFTPGWEKEKETCKHFIPGWNFKMSMFFSFFTNVFKYAFQN